MSYQPPFSISARIINQISAIAEQLGRLSSLQGQSSPQLRKQNRIRTIQSTLAIEGNTLSLDQITAILEGKRVLGNKSAKLPKSKELSAPMKPFPPGTQPPSTTSKKLTTSL